MPDSRAERADESRSVLRDSTPRRLTRDQRLRRRKDFIRVQTDGDRVTTKHFVFLVALNTPGAPARLGITATRKIGCAVVRNRAKRLVRETFRHLPELVPEGVDMVVIVRKALDGLTTPDVIREWRSVDRVLRRRAMALLDRQDPRPT